LNKDKSNLERGKLSASMLRTYWRLRLYDLLRGPALLTCIEIDGKSVRLTTEPWDEYWADTPKMFQTNVRDLRNAWKSYVDSGFQLSRAERYCSAYLGLIRLLLKQRALARCSHRRFLGKTLGFENFVLKLRDVASPFAVATASFRNPAFLSFRCRGLRKHSRNDPSLVALVVGFHRGVPGLFYHYRKQQILRRVDESLLFFPAVDRERRGDSFRGLDALTAIVASEWDSRIEQRSHLLADKVLVPLLTTALPTWATGQRRALRILDIGSGVGLFTSRVIAKIVKSGALRGRKVELSLLDILSVDPKRHFRSRALLPRLGKVEHISHDYIKWLGQDGDRSLDNFDIVFLFRILHNLSVFRIAASPPAAAVEDLSPRRYRVVRHLSSYYQAISLLFPQLADCTAQKASRSAVFHSRRLFDPLCLALPGGQSLIERLTEISSGILIEDADLSSDVLREHMRNIGCNDIKVCELSRALRLSINHIYWITKSREEVPLQGEMIWPA